MRLPALLGKPSAFLPLVMSMTALAMVMVAAARGLATPSADEGTAARVFQLLIAGQVPVAGYFLATSLPEAPRGTVAILAAQIVAALAAVGMVACLEM